MTDQTNNASENGEGVAIEHNAADAKPIRASGWSFPKLSLAVGAAMAALIGVGALTAHSAGGDGEGRGGWGMHRMMGDHGKGGHDRGGRFMENRLGDILKDAGASQEQADKIKTLLQQARTDMEPLRDGMRGSRDEMVALLKAPTVDAAAVEKLRADRIAAMDEASKKAVASVIEAANVLTPEQRAKLATELENFRGGRN